MKVVSFIIIIITTLVTAFPGSILHFSNGVSE